MLLSATLKLIEEELKTDRADDDVTVKLLGERAKSPTRAVIKTRLAGIFSGEVICESFSRLLNPALKIRCLAREGQVLSPDGEIVLLEGPLGLCLSVERTLLNLLSHVCGVATLTRRFVQAVSPHGTKILATRKTLPGLRELQLQAVRAGGGYIHRRNLSDGILLKDNHLSAVTAKEALAQAGEIRSPLHKIEVEVQSLEQLSEVLATPPDIIMLDNLPLPELKRAITQINGRCEIEVSGGMTLDRVNEVAALGVQYISVGQLTHSVQALDLTMDFFHELKQS